MENSLETTTENKPQGRFIYKHSKDLMWMLVFLRVQQAKRAKQKDTPKWNAPKQMKERSSASLCDAVERGWVKAAMQLSWNKERAASRIGDETTHWSDHIEYKKWRNNRTLRTARAIRRKRDPGYRALQSIRSRLHMAMCGIKKVKSTVSLLGCSLDEFKRHIESQFQPGMSWDNYGHKTWHIDHIIPCARFDFTDPEQQRKAFHYTNQRPLWANENLSKGAKLAT